MSGERTVIRATLRIGPKICQVGSPLQIRLKNPSELETTYLLMHGKFVPFVLFVALFHSKKISVHRRLNRKQLQPRLNASVPATAKAAALRASNRQPV